MDLGRAVDLGDQGRARSWEGAPDGGARALYGLINPIGAANPQRCKAPSRGEGRARPVLVARGKGAAQSRFILVRSRSCS